MTTICPRCSAVRPSETIAPEWQCPACGVAYDKVGRESSFRRKAPHPRYATSAAHNDGFPWRKLFGVLIGACALHVGYQAAHRKAGFGGNLDGGVSLSEGQVTELAAASQPQDVLFPWAASGRAIANGRDEGVTKLLFDDSPEAHGHGKILGGGMVGTHAGDMIGEIALAIEMGADAVDIGKTIHPHPTLGESIGMAAEVAHGTCTDVPPVRK